jgi:hypothetical protein
MMMSCNPPPPSTTECPAIAPTTAQYCDYQGPPCYYNSTPICGPMTTATCTGYEWTVQTVFPPCFQLPPDAGPPVDAGVWL